MTSAAIVCEYNPFHNGHKYQIEKTRELCGADAVIAVMSGNWVQRGDIAVFDKHSRAAAAIAGGADLVIELPTVAAVQSAEFFAANAVYIINALNSVSFLSFGAECDNIDLITKTAHFLAHEPSDISKRIKALSDTGISYPAARARAVSEVLGSECADLLTEPNNILAIEYCKALCRLESNITPLPVLRTGAGHHSSDTKDGFASAGYIRSLISKGDRGAFTYMPDFCRRIFADKNVHSLKALEKSIIAEIIKMPVERLCEISDVSEGIENRIKQKATSAESLEQLVDSVKTKRYTHSRIRRILLSAYLGITKQDKTVLPPYVKILAHNETGQKLIRQIKKTASLPIVRNTSQINKLSNPCAKRYWEREREFDLLFELF